MAQGEPRAPRPELLDRLKALSSIEGLGSKASPGFWAGESRGSLIHMGDSRHWHVSRWSIHIQDLKSIRNNGSLYSIAEAYILNHGKGKETTP